MEGATQKLVIASKKKKKAQVLCEQLRSHGVSIKTFSFEGLPSKLKKETPDCLLLLEQEKVDPTLIEGLKRYDDQLPIIVLSPSQKVEEVVSLMKAGIYDYFMWPAPIPKLKIAIQNACRLYALTKRVFLLENQLGVETKLDQIIASSAPMQTIFQTIRNVAKTNATVLITGESGTGKELVAKAIHHLSKRVSRRFIDINCGAIPRELLENELFGHERGAFTGADHLYIGCCERADGGSLFLDEVSEMDLSLQVKLLRFLQERQFCRVGGGEPIRVDVGIIAATNKDLSQCVKQGTFREDLFFRLNVVMIPVPPLRERKEDILLLAQWFLEKYSHKNEKPFLGFTEEAMAALLAYEWPGNVRELENTIERAVVLHNDTKIKVKYLPAPLHGVHEKNPPLPEKEKWERITPKKILPLNLIERYAIEQALKACTGNVSLAARRLKIGQATLYRKIRLYGLET